MNLDSPQKCTLRKQTRGEKCTIKNYVFKIYGMKYTMQKILLCQRYFELCKISAKYNLYDESVLAGGNHFERSGL